MNLQKAIELVEYALENPVSTWLDFTPKNVPLVLYDDQGFAFINHPDPPAVRPSRLSAATAVEINGILTAAIPVEMCDDEQSLVPLVYHECFHVYQGFRFQFKGEYIFFEVLAFYPELNPDYRALCSAETDIFNNRDLTNVAKVRLLAAMAQKRRQILAKHDGLINFEHDLERNEGTATFVEQKAKYLLFAIPPDDLTCSYNYSRQYFMGAAACRLLEQMYSAKDWQAAVERGTSLSELIAQGASPQTDLSPLQLQDRKGLEKQKVEQILADMNQKIETLFRDGAITFKFPSQSNVYRTFSPRSILSSGNGRLIHPEFVRIQTSNGVISVENAMTLEDYNHNTVSFSANPGEVKDNKLEINTEKVKVSLENIRQLPDGDFEILEMWKTT